MTENTIGEADIDIEKLQKWIANTNEETTARSRKERLDFEKELFETKLHFETELKKNEQQVSAENSLVQCQVLGSKRSYQS